MIYIYFLDFRFHVFFLYYYQAIQINVLQKYPNYLLKKKPSNKENTTMICKLLKFIFRKIIILNFLVKIRLVLKIEAIHRNKTILQICS